ncbi:alpha/beta hydrolase [Sungkyunkwania multivorans]|uniref:Alpha/beta hydrolase n=1 Tax=Sungkyunkwania multivorans TaxID=1173618 RepID=A0ABW3CWW0_9FLAO
MSNNKQVSYRTTNSYSTLNSLMESTQNVWIACHGLGYLSKYFINYFKGLDAASNYIIAPQAPSKYYQNNEFRHVGASWLTKEDTRQEIENVLNYLDAVFANENIPKNKRLILLGYSQGVSIITRWLASRKLHCDKLILHSGGIPKELETDDFEFLRGQTQTYLVYGNEDQYLNEERVAYECARANELFGSELHILPFEGKHEVNTKILTSLVQ